MKFHACKKKKNLLKLKPMLTTLSLEQKDGETDTIGLNFS